MNTRAAVSTPGQAGRSPESVRWYRATTVTSFSQP